MGFGPVKEEAARRITVKIADKLKAYESPQEKQGKQPMPADAA